MSITRNRRILNLLSIPRHETTKGLLSKERNDAVERFHKIQNLDVIDQPKNGPFLTETKRVAIEKFIDGHENYLDLPTPSVSLITEPKRITIEKDKTSGSEYVASFETDSSYDERPTQKKFKKLSDACALTLDSELSITNQAGKKVQNKRHASTLPSASNIDVIEPATNKAVKRVRNKRHASAMSAVSSNINIIPATNQAGKRVRNKRHACLYCNTLILTPARHLERCHKNETDVSKLLALNKNSIVRKEGFASIVKSGDFHYNCEVIALKKGDFILIRRPTEEESKFVSYHNYGPCPNCLGFLLKKHLWHHLKSCSSKKEDIESCKTVIAESNALLHTLSSQLSADFTVNIVNNIRNDDVGQYCKKDGLIEKFGLLLFEKYGTTQCEMIRQSMRQLSRLALTLNENTEQELNSFLVPEKFDSVVEATKKLCITHMSQLKRPEFNTPSLALKIGHALKKCASIERGIALRQRDLKKDRLLQSFLDLLEMEWAHKISSNALATLYNRKLNAAQLLPVTSDLQKLNNHIDKEIGYAISGLQRVKNYRNWGRLAQLTLTRIILFNKRRSGEASRMTLQQYNSTPVWTSQTNDELKKSLTELELKLAEKLSVVNIIGKRGRKVPIILTPQAKTSIDLLIKYRKKCMVNELNHFVFARSGSSILSIRGNDCLRTICSEVSLENPEFITSTKLRKYIATVCQVFNLSENEHDWLARHLGHDIRVHREFYRLHVDTVELTKVSRLLLAVDNGEASQFAGKKLEDINLQELPEVDGEDENENEEENASGDEDNNEYDDNKEDKELNDGINVNISVNKEKDYTKDSTSGKQTNDQKKKRKSRPKNKSNKSQIKGSKKSCIKHPWDEAELEAVVKFFKFNVKHQIVPGKAKCTECIAQNSRALSRRSWTDVKFQVKNMITRNKRLLKK